MTELPQDNNLLLNESPLPLQAPIFDQLKTSDYIPAFHQGMAQHNAEIEAIINNSAAADFDNTIKAMEMAGQLLARAHGMFENMSALMSNDEMVSIENEMLPQLTAHYDNINLSSQLFARIEAVYQQRETLNAEQQRLVELYYSNLVRAGAKLNDADKASMREINTKLAKLSSDFSQQILASFKDDVILVQDKAQLTGLSQDDIDSLANAAQEAGESGYLITLVNTTRQPILSKLANRELRQTIWEKSSGRLIDSNGPKAIEQALLRAQKAQLLGFNTWAEYGIDNQMAKTPTAVFNMLDELAPQALTKAKQEAADIQAMMSAENSGLTLAPWDWAYYADKVRSEKYNLDDSQTKPYFEYQRVVYDGLFFAMNKLYGISVKDRTDLPVWHSDVTAHEVLDADGSTIGLFYLDPYARKGKSGGAWMSEYVGQSKLLGTKPVVYNSLNIPKPASGQPTLLTFDEVTTLYHEFGHALHGLFSDVTYPSLAGTATSRDFVELPSQFTEDWSIHPQVLANYAKHYQTGEAIPADLLANVLKAHKFNTGFDTTEYLAAALLDMEWHSITADTEIDNANEFELTALAKHGLDFDPVPPRFKTPYFSHCFAGGYSAGYYAYLWTEVFAADAYAHMQTLAPSEMGLTRENGQLMRDTILSKGNSQDLMQCYINFRGQQPELAGLLRRRGLVD